MASEATHARRSIRLALAGQSLLPKWEEMTAEDFVKAIKQAPD
jgi:hypothetical protein